MESEWARSKFWTRHQTGKLNMTKTNRLLSLKSLKIDTWPKFNFLLNKLGNLKLFPARLMNKYNNKLEPVTVVPKPGQVTTNKKGSKVSLKKTKKSSGELLLNWWSTQNPSEQKRRNAGNLKISQKPIYHLNNFQGYLMNDTAFVNKSGVKVHLNN